MKAYESWLVCYRYVVKSDGVQIHPGTVNSADAAKLLYEYASTGHYVTVFPDYDNIGRLELE